MLFSVCANRSLFLLPAEASDDECRSMASSNTEIYEEADYQDFEVCEEESGEAVIKTGVNDLDALADVSFQFHSQRKLFENNKTQQYIFHDLVLTSRNHSALVDQCQDNSRHVPINTILASLKYNHLQAVPIHFRNAFDRSSDNLCNPIVLDNKESVMRESRISNDIETNSKHSPVNDDSSKYQNTKRISVGTGIVYEDELS